MWDRKRLKNNAKESFYRNWRQCIIISLIYAVLVGGTIISFNSKEDLNFKDNIKDIATGINGESNSDIVNEFLHEIKNETPKKESNIISSATRGVLGTIANNVSKSGSFIFGFLNAINQFLFKDHIFAFIIIIVGAILSLLYWVFVSKVLEVGTARFFLETRKYSKTKSSKIILPYKMRRTLNTAKVMFLKNLYTILWAFTIVGPFIKYYEYLLVPFIIAENPNIKAKDALKLSKNMMYGYKWQAFITDLSFIGWNIIGLLTFNISNILFTNAYVNLTHAEIYMYLREVGKNNKITNIEYLKDKNLEGEVENSEYPWDEYLIKVKKNHKLLELDYDRKYSLGTLIIIFFIIAIVGWIWEVLLHLFQYGSLVNRGTLHGPWLPIYGFGVIAMLVILKPFRKNPFAYFVLTMLLCGIIEYGTSLYLELHHGLSWWDYHGFFLNLNGRICLEGLLLFGVGGLAATYIIAPLLGNFIDKLDKKTKIWVSIVLVLIISFDFYISGKIPNTGSGVTNEIKESKLSKYKT